MVLKDQGRNQFW